MYLDQSTDALIKYFPTKFLPTAPLNGPYRSQSWSVTDPIGNTIHEGSEISSMPPYEYFLWVFPMRHFTAIVSWTDANLQKKGVEVLTSAGEVLKFFGVIILMTRFEFSKRRDLWKTESSFKYKPVAKFGRFIARNRFEVLMSCIAFSRQSECTSPGSSDRRWGLVQDFVTAINSHRASRVSPSSFICVDESISRWYGLGGSWLDKGLPHYVAIDRKPENGCELQTAACGESGIMLSIEVVMAKEDYKGKLFQSGCSHSVAMTRRLTNNWANSNRIVIADSYFSSAATAEALADAGLRLIGCVKNATKGYPKKELSETEAEGRGFVKTMVCRQEGKRDMMAIMLVDSQRKSTSFQLL